MSLTDRRFGAYAKSAQLRGIYDWLRRTMDIKIIELNKDSAVVLLPERKPNE